MTAARPEPAGLPPQIPSKDACRDSPLTRIAEFIIGGALRRPVGNSTPASGARLSGTRAPIQRRSGCAAGSLPRPRPVTPRARSARWISGASLCRRADSSANDRGSTAPPGSRRWKPAALPRAPRATTGMRSRLRRRMPRMPESPASPPATMWCRPAHPGDDRIPNRDAKWRSDRTHFHQSLGLDRSYRPPRLLWFFGTENDLEKPKATSRPPHKKIPLVNFCGGEKASAAHANPKFTKNIHAPLKPNRLLRIFRLPRQAVRAPFAGPVETGAGGVRRLLVPILLNGGFGYEDLRLCSPVAVDDRVRPLLRSGRCSAACGQRR